jgi:hypothetical protein
MAQPHPGAPVRSEADEGDPAPAFARVEGGPDESRASNWNDPVFGDLLPASPAGEARPSESPSTFRPVTQGGAADEPPVDTSRFIKTSTPWARAGVAAAVVLGLGLVGLAVTRGPGHTAAERLVLSSPTPYQEANEALLSASMRIGKACGEGGAKAPAKVRATFDADGKVLSAIALAPYAGTPIGDCIVANVLELQSRPFSGPPVTVTELISLAP